MSKGSHIDRLKALGDALDETDAQLYRFFQLCPVVMVITDTTYFRRVSRFTCVVLGYTEPELLARPWAAIVHPDDRSRSHRVRQSLLAGVPSVEFQTRVRRADGNYLRLDWTSSPYTDAGLAYSVAAIGRGDGGGDGGE